MTFRELIEIIFPDFIKKHSKIYLAFGVAILSIGAYHYGISTFHFTPKIENLTKELKA